jgi:hypothetical protein
MRTFRISRLAAKVLSAAALVAAMTAAFVPHAHASFVGTDYGYGSTLQAAEQNALLTLRSDDYGCVPPADYPAYGQLANGTWWAEVQEICQGYN